jgi:hypothetical protein
MTTSTTHTTDNHEGTTMTENPTPARRTLRDRLPRRLPSGRKAIAAGAVVAGLAIGGAGFGAGYAVADDGAGDTTTQTSDDWAERGHPGDGRGPMGQMPGSQMGGGMGGQMGGTTGEPDFDGDGVPDTDSGSDTSDSATQNS